MRIAQLRLERYGHLTGEVLDFPGDRGLHIILGGNEAGKSTALQAVADALFGFEAKTRTKGSHAFHHRPDTLRVGLSLVAADGRVGSFVRRKGYGSTLMDPAGSSLPESALAPFLSGTSRKRFEQVFGLDAAELRTGAAAILTEQAGAGAAILQARTGLRGLRDAITRLDAEAKTLYGDGRGQRRISAAAAAVKDNRALVAARCLSGTAYRDAEAAVARLTASLADLDAQAARLRGEQARLERIRRTAPVRAVLRRAEADRAALGFLPALPHDAATIRRQALADFEQAARDCAQEEQRSEAALSERDALPFDAAILSEADLVTALAADRMRIASARGDLEVQRTLASRHQHEADQAGAMLGLLSRGDALRAAIPDALTRSQAARLMSQHAKLSGARDQATAALEAAREAASAARLACDNHPASPPDQTLRDAVAAATREGRIDGLLAEAEAAHTDAEAVATLTLAGLPLWSGPVEALAAAPVPLEAEALRLAVMLDEAREALRLAQADLEAQDRVRAAIQAELAAAAAAGPLPTTGDVASARAARDALWALIRQGLEQGGLAAADASGFGSPEAWPGELSRLLREADLVADLRLSEARRVEAWDRLRAEEARESVAREGLVAARDRMRTALDDTADAWCLAWQPAGVRPLDPPAMRDWVRQRDKVLALYQQAEQARRKRDAVRNLHSQVRAGLLARLPGCDGDVAALVHVASRMLVAADLVAEAHARAQADAKAGDAGVLKAERSVAVTDAKLGTWQSAWKPVAAKLGLPADAPAADATTALDAWTKVEASLHDADAAQDRVNAMKEAVSAHDGQLAELARSLSLDPADGLIPLLSERLAAAQQTRTALLRLDGEHRSLAASAASHGERRDRAEATLASLRQAAGVADDAALEEAISHAATHAELATRIVERTSELNRLDDGKAVAELEAEAAGEDIDAIPGRLAEIGMLLSELDANRTAQAGERADAQSNLRALEVAQDVSGPAQVAADGLVEIEDAAARYVRLRLAHALLQGGVDRYRKSQQGPLLERAGELFAQVTGNRYCRLELDEDEKGGPVIAAARPDGTRCNADHLSEGARDQLFLALRLAAIALEAEASEPMPLIADDLLVNFDDARARAAVELLAGFGQVTQVILFTHHAHVAAMAEPATVSLHHLPGRVTS